MATPQSSKDHRLFHYTKRIEHLQGMLREGFWPRYCVEDFSWLIGCEAYIAFPMVCFCDIPIEAASEHRERYGRYAIAMSKIWAIVHDINPVWYIQANSSIYSHLKHAVEFAPRIDLSTIPASLKPLLPFLKLTVGSQPDRSGRHLGQMDVLAFEEELEWRHTPRALFDRWNFGYDRNIVTDGDHALSNSHRLSLDRRHIDSVFVSTESERAAIGAEFPWLSGKVEVSPF